MSDPSFPVPTSFQVSNGGSQEEEKKVGYVNYEVEPGFTIRLRQNIDPAMDPKKLRRSGYIIWSRLIIYLFLLFWHKSFIIHLTVWHVYKP